jgi:hypothetical protein
VSVDLNRYLYGGRDFAYRARVAAVVANNVYLVSCGVRDTFMEGMCALDFDGFVSHIVPQLIEQQNARVGRGAQALGWQHARWQDDEGWEMVHLVVHSVERCQDARRLLDLVTARTGSSARYPRRRPISRCASGLVEDFIDPPTPAKDAA